MKKIKPQTYALLLLILLGTTYGWYLPKLMVIWSDMRYSGKYQLKTETIEIKKGWYKMNDADWWVLKAVGLSALEKNGERSKFMLASIRLDREKCDRKNKCRMSLDVFTEEASKSYRKNLKSTETIKLDWGEVIITKRYEDGSISYFSKNHNIQITVYDAAHLEDIKSIYKSR